MTQNQGDQAPAHAPYNFIPLSETVIDGRDTFADGKPPSLGVYDPGLHHGYFDVILTTESPLYIRGMLTSAEDAKRAEHKNKPDFFHVGSEDEPVIPGSSLRGMLRSLFEIVTFSKMDRVSAQRLFFRTVDDTVIGKEYGRRMVGKVEAGYLTRSGDTWQITRCERLRVEHTLLVGDEGGRGLFDDKGPNQRPKWSNGKWTQYQRVWVKTGTESYLVDDIQARDPKTPGFRPGILVITGNVPKKKKEFVFLLPDADAEIIVVPDEKVKRFHDEDQISKWQEKAFPKDQPVSAARKKAGGLQENPPAPGEPVFFLREGGVLTFFGRAQMFRLPYRTSPHDLIPPAHLNNNVIDMTEAVFGFVRQSKEGGEVGQARAGRVFVTDARLVEGQTDVLDAQGALTPPILSSPKPTTFQHYLDQTGSRSKADRKHYDTARVKLRGQKLYWRQRVQNLEQLPGAQRAPREDTQSTRLRAVNPTKQFHFCIHFENLNRVELGALAFALTLHGMGDNARHMLGMGKPFGMGIVHLESRLVLCDRTARYQTLFDDSGWATGDSEAYEAAQPEVIQPFVDYMTAALGAPFEAHERIQALRVMLQSRDLLPAFDAFGYMSLGQFTGRPVLPPPSSVHEAYQNHKQKLRQIERDNQPIEVGSLVNGKVVSSDEDYVWFRITSGKTRSPYKAAVASASTQINPDGTMPKLIVEAIEQDGEITYYWCRRETKTEREQRRKGNQE